MSKLEEQIQEVAALRSIAAANKEILNIDREKWEIDNKEQILSVKSTQCDVELAEIKLRELTLEAYADTGDKAPAPGVSVKIFQVLSYEQAEAMKWASEHRVALKLDVSIFEKIVKVDKPSFVTITEEPRAQIAKSLG